MIMVGNLFGLVPFYLMGVSEIGNLLELQNSGHSIMFEVPDRLFFLVILGGFVNGDQMELIIPERKSTSVSRHENSVQSPDKNTNDARKAKGNKSPPKPGSVLFVSPSIQQVHTFIRRKCPYKINSSTLFHCCSEI